MVAWPAGLPQEQFLEVRLMRVGNVIRTPMAVGPAKLRRRASVDVREVDLPIVLNTTQYDALEVFYATTLQEVLPFTWEDPRDDATVNFRFRRAPSMSLKVGENAAGERVWSGRLALEIVP